ncbi:hypothetical protein AB0M95_31540, partial [Sphaerisporangium sp. NPDC051017]|uniref:hypothetical protein n=1 Tax=Sphaerisporangium sp. NPDC051017 TaxID=3154636 RepID=UPI00341F498C
TEPSGSKACGDPVRPLRWRRSVKQEAAEVPHVRHRLNLRHSCRRAHQKTFGHYHTRLFFNDRDIDGFRFRVGEGSTRDYDWSGWKN